MSELSSCYQAKMGLPTKDRPKGLPGQGAGGNPRSIMRSAFATCQTSSVAWPEGLLLREDIHHSDPHAMILPFPGFVAFRAVVFGHAHSCDSIRPPSCHQPFAACPQGPTELRLPTFVCSMDIPAKRFICQANLVISDSLPCFFWSPGVTTSPNGSLMRHWLPQYVSSNSTMQFQCGVSLS